MAITVLGLDSIDGGIDGSDGSTSSKITYRSTSTTAPGTQGDVAITAAVVAAVGLDVGSAYPFDASSYCRKISSRCQVRREGGTPKWEWLTTFEFTSKTDGSTGSTSSSDPNTVGGFSKQKDPTARPPKISVSYRAFDEPVARDIFNRRVANSAGDPIVRTRKNAHLIFKWERVMRRWDWSVNLPVHAGGYLYSTNLRAWRPAGPYGPLLGNTRVAAGQARMESITSEISFDNGGCVIVGVEIAIDFDKFQDVFLDQGFFYLSQAGVTSHSSGVPSMARSRFLVNGGYASSPQLLDGAGRPLGNDAQPQTITRQYYAPKNWDDPPWGPQNGNGVFFAFPGGG